MRARTMARQEVGGGLDLSTWHPRLAGHVSLIDQPAEDRSDGDHPPGAVLRNMRTDETVRVGYRVAGLLRGCDGARRLADIIAPLSAEERRAAVLALADLVEAGMLETQALPPGKRRSGWPVTLAVLGALVLGLGLLVAALPWPWGGGWRGLAGVVAALLLAWAVSKVLHEAGHCLAALALGAPVETVGLAWAGRLPVPHLRIDPPADWGEATPRRLALIGLAGPMADLAAAAAGFAALLSSPDGFAAFFWSGLGVWGLWGALAVNGNPWWPHSDMAKALRLLTPKA